MRTLLFIVGGIIIIMSGIIGFQMNESDNFGSVDRGGEYKYTHISGSGIASTTLLRTGPGTFGSVIITEDQAGAVIMYDATSTEALSGGSSLYSTIATFESAQTEGVYTFDVSVYNGLVISLAGETFAGNWTVTYR